MLASACAQFEPGTDTLEDATGTLRPPASSVEWACLGDAATGPAPEPVLSDAAERVVVSLQIVDLSTGQTYPDAALRACGIADINCERPVIDGLQVDGRGWVDVPLFAGFTGFFEITSPSISPFLLYFTDPLPPNSVIEYPLAVVSRASLGPLVQLLGVPLDPNTGVIAFRAFDCDGQTATGVSYTLDRDGVAWYIAGGLPNGMSTATSGEGIGGFANVPAGLAVVDALAPDGRSIAGPQSVIVRPGWMSGMFVRPIRRSTP